MDKRLEPVKQVRIRAEVYQEVKVAAARADKSITDWITEAIKAKLANSHS